MAFVKGNLIYALLVFVAGSSYGFIVPVIKLAKQDGFVALDFLATIYVIAFVISLAATLVKRAPLASPGQLAKLAFLGVLTSCTSVCYYNAVALLPSAVALTLLFQYVWIGIVIECVIDKALPSASTVAAVIIVLLGTFLAAGVFEGSFSQLDPAGLALGMGSAVFYALFLFSSSRIGKDESAFTKTTMASIGGIIVTTLANPYAITTALSEPSIWPYALALAFLGVLIPVGLIAFAGPHLSTGVVNIMASSELPVGVLAAWAIVAEEPTLTALAGVILVLAGIVLNQAPALKSAFVRSSNGRSHEGS